MPNLIKVASKPKKTRYDAYVEQCREADNNLNTWLESIKGQPQHGMTEALSGIVYDAALDVAKDMLLSPLDDADDEARVFAMQRLVDQLPAKVTARELTHALKRMFIQL